MLWRVRTTLPDRPGTLAVLAERCGRAGVNILGLQIFPGVEDVTDELVLRTPLGWEADRVISLLEDAGGAGVVVLPCREAALADQPTRYVHAARMILERPMSFPEVVAQLFDTEAEPALGEGVELDVMELVVGEVEMQVRRQTPFTTTEHARGAALADLVNDVLQRGRDQAAIGSPASAQPLEAGAVPEYVVSGDTVTAYAGEVAVGVARVLGVADDPDGPGETIRPLSLHVDPAWRRRGIGTRLLVDAARLAREFGAAEVLVTARSDNRAVLPTVLAAGLRGRMRVAGDVLTVRVPVRELKPLHPAS